MDRVNEIIHGQVLCPVFNTNRMVREYSEKFYLPSAEHFAHLSEDNFSAALKLAAWKSKIVIEWGDVHFLDIQANLPSKLNVGDHLEVKARVQLGKLSPEEVSVELFLGRLDTKRNITHPIKISMELENKDKDGTHIFATGTIPINHSGLHGYTVRIIPRHENLVNPLDIGLLKWAEA